MTMPFGELKQRQSAMWGNGPYQRITETLGDIHERVIDANHAANGEVLHTREYLLVVGTRR
jgi:hypothetical protein